MMQRTTSWMFFLFASLLFASNALAGDAVILEAATSCQECVAPCPNCKPKAPKPSPYKGLFYNNDFDYLTEPYAQRTQYYEYLKRLSVTDSIIFDVGGEFRHQFKNENRRSLLTGVPSNPRTDSFNLWRLRVYSNVEIGEYFRTYVEFIDAHSTHEDLPPIAIDENRSDLLNAFGEVKLPWAPGDSVWKVRVGRQELLEGSQRLISPLDWSNTRRTFEGAKLLSTGKRWDYSLFWTRPILVDNNRFNRADESSWFGGFYSTYKCFENQTFSPYFLVLREEDLIPGNPITRGGRIGSGNVDTTTYTSGLEIKGGLGNWLWNVEGAYQFGNSGSQDISAGMFTAGLGRKMPNLAWKPTFWAWYDWASGDDNPNDSTIGTFNHLFPLGHKYLGFVDLVGRSNIHDVNFQFFLNPHEKLQLLAWAHFFWLADDRDGLYNVADVISFRDPTGNSGSEIGQEINLSATWKVRPGVDFQLGYAHFFSGDFIENQGGQDSAYLLYSQLAIKF